MKRVFTASVILLLLTSVSALSQAGSARTDKELASVFDAAIQRTLAAVPDIPGIAFVVIRDDKPIFLKAYGIADKEANVTARNDTLFYMGSTTKSFTALVAAMLDKEGKIKLGDPVTKYTQGINFKTPLPDKITVRDLLTHTSGLRNPDLVHRTAYTGQIDKAEIAYVFANGTTLDESLFGKYRYTNLGYNIYGLLLENHLRLKWQDELQSRIFTPMGLKRSTAYRSKAVAKRWPIAAPYIWDEQAGAVVRSPVDKIDNNMQAAGGHFMSITDLGKWLNMNMNGGRLNGKQIIPADLINAVHTGHTKSTRNEPPFSGDGEYGLGWQIGKYRSEKVIYHHGGYSGYRTHVSFMPEKSIAVGVLVNNDLAGGRVADMLAAYAYDLWLGTPDLETIYAKQLQDFSAQYAKRKRETMAGAAQRAKRKPQLTEPLASYTGRYTHELLGTFEITIAGDALAARMGNLYSVSTPYTEKDSIRVVMIPGGDGEIIAFTRDADGKFSSLSYAGRTFTRVR